MQNLNIQNVNIQNLNIQDYKEEKYKLRRVWDGMIARCTNPKHKGYANYGGRGITVSNRWRVYDNFINDMLPSYLEHVKIHGARQTTLDRIDNNGPYSIENCRWATYHVQNVNRNTTPVYKLRDGRVLNMEEIAKIFNVPQQYLDKQHKQYKLLKDHTWPEEGHYLEDTVPGYFNNLIMARRDPKKPLGPDNHWWALSNKASAASSELSDGTPCTKEDLAEVTGHTLNQIRRLLYTGKETAKSLWLKTGNPSTDKLKSRTAFKNKGDTPNIFTINNRTYTLRTVHQALNVDIAVVRQLHNTWLRIKNDSWADESEFMLLNAKPLQECKRLHNKAFCLKINKNEPWTQENLIWSKTRIN